VLNRSGAVCEEVFNTAICVFGDDVVLIKMNKNKN
jgi:hypothetical protein